MAERRVCSSLVGIPRQSDDSLDLPELPLHVVLVDRLGLTEALAVALNSNAAVLDIDMHIGWVHAWQVCLQGVLGGRLNTI